MSGDPKRVHEVDQAMAGAAALGGMFARLFAAMCEEGMTEEQALSVVKSYALGLAPKRNEGER